MNPLPVSTLQMMARGRARSRLSETGVISTRQASLLHFNFLLEKYKATSSGITPHSYSFLFHFVATLSRTIGSQRSNSSFKAIFCLCSSRSNEED
jgi:hypothetical protein